MANGDRNSASLARRRHIGGGGDKNMKTIQRIPGCLAITSAAVIAAFPILRSPQEWQTRICEPDTFLLAFTLACAAILLWPRRCRLARR
jgi:hypothetical protein